MTGAHRRRLSRSARRAQLVSTARDIVATEGADQLTLARLANRAEISKPVVYDHFPSRSALLISLYQEFERRQIDDLRAALVQAPPTLQARVETIAEAHVSCLISYGIELGGVAAALSGTPDLEKAKQGAERCYLDICRQGIRDAGSAADLDEEGALAFLCTADALGHAAARGTISAERARSTITQVLLKLIDG